MRYVFSLLIPVHFVSEIHYPRSQMHDNVYSEIPKKTAKEISFEELLICVPWLMMLPCHACVLFFISRYDPKSVFNVLIMCLKGAD